MSDAVNNSYRIVKTPKQIEAVRLIGKNKITLLGGGSRSGKTFIILYIMVLRALSVAGSHHLVCRFRFSHAKQSICYQTMPKLLKALGLTGKVTLNKSDWFYEFQNGSTIWIGGLDDKDRTEKILGNEYSTIFLNEASQISYSSYEILITRLNPSQGLHGKIIIDYNPPSIQHWGYKIFVQRRFPDGRPVPDDDYASITINPKDNPHNQDEYLITLSTLSEAKRRRFESGEYSVDSGTLWRRSMIHYMDLTGDLMRVVIGVDPSGTVDGDEIGIVAVGQGVDGFYYILEDASLNGTPNEWASEVAALYDKWRADIVVAEKNFGGDMVESTIRNAKPGINVKLVNASRGKIVRAEPVSALYEQGKVFHRIPFMNLEDEMCIYEPNADFSPNRMDAMVWGMTELTGEGVSILDVI